MSEHVYTVMVVNVEGDEVARYNIFATEQEATDYRNDHSDTLGARASADGHSVADVVVVEL
jgi:hypothetical protein